MTDDYTPDTEEVRELYWAVSGLPRRDPKAWEEFDRWLRKVKAEAWDEAVDSASLEETESRLYIYHDTNPYRD